MRVPALLARAVIVVFALASGLAGAAAAAQITDSAGGTSLEPTVIVGSVTAQDNDRDGGKDRDKDRRGKQLERSGQVAADEDQDTADEDTADEDTADTETTDTKTEDTEDEETKDTEDEDTGDTDDTEDGD